MVGAYAALTKRHHGVLTAYLLATTVFAAVWPADNLGIQKNPAGQLIANAILLLLVYKPVRRLLPCLLVLMPGLFLTQSRGAVVALVVGVAVLALFHPSRGRTILTRVVPLVVIGAIAFTQLSTAQQQRLTSFSSGTQTRADYAVKIRHEYAHDAKQVIAAHPFAGVGIGNYLITSSVGASTTDPHEVVLLEAAEGGYGFAAAFIVLILGSSVLLYRLRRLDLAPAAAAIVLATFTHGLVDVYWVRGTPVLSWLLLGMVCGMYRARTRGRNRVSVRPVRGVVVAYFGEQHLDRCLTALAGAIDLTVVDNSSSDAVREVAVAHGVRYLDAGANLGFAAGVNVGLREIPESSDCDVLLLNPDAIVEPDALRALSTAMHVDGNERVGVVAPRIHDADGHDQRVAWPFPSPLRAWGEAVGLGRLPYRQGFLIGAVLLLRREALQDVGMFDERFFLYAEETDWQRRAVQHGWTSLLAETNAEHIGAGTSSDPAMREILFHAAQETYVRKWYGGEGGFSIEQRLALGRRRALFLGGERRAEAARRARLYVRGPRRSAALTGR